MSKESPNEPAAEWLRRLGELRAGARRPPTLPELGARLRAGASMLTRCAWCDRIQVRDRWVVVDELLRGGIPPAALERLTHGICPSCLEAFLPAEPGVDGGGTPGTPAA